MATKVLKSFEVKPIVLTMEHISGAIITMACGFSISSLVFCFEHYVNNNIIDRNVNGLRKKLFNFADKLIDGERHLYILAENPKGREHSFRFSCFRRNTKVDNTV